MSSLNDWALRFIRWGMGLTLLGLITGYLPLGHYLMKDSLPSYPMAPVHGHVILLSFVGMPIFGLIYRALPTWMGSAAPPLGLIRAHFYLAVIAILGVCFNGTIGYELLEMLAQNDFYYIGQQGQHIRNIWFGIDGVFLTLFGVGCMILWYVVVKKTAYGESRQ